jgi:hypothetical protein
MRIISLKPRWSKVISTSVSVGASIEVCEEFIGVDFAVREPVNCFCQSKERDGEAVCEDSCVEIFTNMLDRSGRYINFEFNSKGVCHAARGKEREDRVELSKEEYANVTRNPGKISNEGDFVRWTLSVQIPRELLGAAGCDLRKSLIEGNIYKCADLAKEPHWLSAFPINTKKPDFHRPECFEDLNSPSWSS